MRFKFWTRYIGRTILDEGGHLSSLGPTTIGSTSECTTSSTHVEKRVCRVGFTALIIQWQVRRFSCQLEGTADAPFQGATVNRQDPAPEIRLKSAGLKSAGLKSAGLFYLI